MNIMAHGHETGLAWEWDSVLLLANPSLASHSLEGDRSTSCALPVPPAGLIHEHDHEHHDHNHEKFHIHETSSADHMQTDSISSGSQQMGADQEWRDPRLDCPNFLAGRVPCACTVNDDDDSGVSRKRSKPVPRCQVQSCGAELTNLKGYHQRHRVCLRCAHANRVVLRNQPHRYCQQCGKFHPICDFDEGKRSCRRKLERHNNRRRRKALESEDSLPPLDSGDIEFRSDSSPTDERSNNTNLTQPLERDEKATSGGRAEQSFQAAVTSPNDNLSALGETVENVNVITGSGVDGAMDCLDSSIIKVVDDGLSTSEPPRKGTEAAEDSVFRLGHKKDCLSHPEYAPLNSDVQLSDTQDICSYTLPAHCIAARDVVEAEQVVRGHDEESLLALLMEDTSSKEDSGLTQNASADVNDATQLWESSRGLIRLNKQATYSAPNPTGRISFKLYDWNPGDFPRQLRQQVMEWLSNMPVDLEGYIRSGCTILTLFISMPQPMWEKLSADWKGSVCSLVKTQGSGSKFWNSGHLIARLDQHVVHIHGGEAVQPLSERGRRSSVLQGLHPICIEAGVEQVVVISGSNLRLPESKLLVSFDGTYIKTDVSPPQSSSRGEQPESSTLLQATIPALHSQKFGTAFIEVEHNGGLSNFIPLLVAEKKIVDEIRTLEQEIDTPTTSSCCSSGSSDSRSEHMNQRKIQDLLVDVGWVLRNYTLVNFKSYYEAGTLGQDFERLRRLLHFSVRRGWCTIVERVLQVAERAGLLERIGFLNNGLTALHVALLHEQFAMFEHLTHFTASLPAPGLHSGRCWWDVDCPVPRGLVSGQSLAIKARTLGNGSAKLQINKTIWKVLKGQMGHIPNTLPSPKERLVSSSSNSVLTIHVASEDYACSKDFSYGPTPNQSADYHKVDVSCSTGQEEARFSFPSMDSSSGMASTWKSLLMRDDVERLGRSYVPYKRSGCSMEGLGTYLSRASKRKPLYASSVGVLLVCAGLCVMLQHPNQVIELSMSLRRCLWGLQNGPV